MQTALGHFLKFWFETHVFTLSVLEAENKETKVERAKELADAGPKAETKEGLQETIDYVKKVYWYQRRKQLQK